MHDEAFAAEAAEARAKMARRLLGVIDRAKSRGLGPAALAEPVAAFVYEAYTAASAAPAAASSDAPLPPPSLLSPPPAVAAQQALRLELDFSDLVPRALEVYSRLCLPPPPPLRTALCVVRARRGASKFMEHDLPTCFPDLITPLASSPRSSRGPTRRPPPVPPMPLASSTSFR